MKLFRICLGLTVGKLCRQLPLLAGLALFCAFLALLGGRTAQALLSQGISFSGLTLAVTAPEGDQTPALLERYLGTMSDLRAYCRIAAMEEEDALAALAEGRVAAVLVLPEGFVQGVQQGENPAVRVIVDGDRPLESLLTLWVGQRAADLLSAVQGGIYGVLDCYDGGVLTAALPRDQVVTEINLRYVQWVLNRQAYLPLETRLPTGQLPVETHYTLSLFFWLLLSLAPAAAWNYQGTWPAGYRRLGWVGGGWTAGLLASLTAGALVMALPLWAGLLWAAGGGAPLPLLGAAVCCGWCFALWSALCALTTRTAAGCAGLSFLLSLAALVASGGLIPPVLLPEALRRLSWCSPITWMRALAASAMGYPADWPAGAVLAGLSLPAALAAAGLYRRRVGRAEP